MKAKPKFVAPKSLEKADKMLDSIKRHEEMHEQFKDYIQSLPKPERFPVYLTIEEISHIILAVEYADVDKYCDNTVLTDINARLGACLANHYLAREV
jgi:hypothetical protein